MPRFELTIPVVFRRVFDIEADNEQEVHEFVDSGDFDVIEDEHVDIFGGVMPPALWSLRERSLEDLSKEAYALVIRSHNQLAKMGVSAGLVAELSEWSDKYIEEFARASGIPEHLVDMADDV